MKQRASHARGRQRKRVPGPESPFTPVLLDEETELRALTWALQFSEGFTLLFVCCNPRESRLRLMARLDERMVGLHATTVAFQQQPIEHLLDALRQRFAEPPTDPIFVIDLEASLPEAEDAWCTPLIRNLNAARNSFAVYLRGPLVLFVPQFVLTAIQRGAPDFFSIHSGSYHFSPTPPEAAARVAFLSSFDHSAMRGLVPEERQARAKSLSEMLAELRALPARQQDVLAEARLLNQLANLHVVMGNFAEAETLYKRTLAIREKALGPDHPDVATSLNNLAELYRTRGQYAQAEPLYKRSLAIRKKALGPNHPDVAQSLNNLAGLYQTQGQYAQAEPLFKRSLAIREKALGPNHPDVATSLNNLAGLYYTQGRYAQAEPLYKRSLAIAEKALGPDHPDVAGSLHNLAGLYDTQGRYAQAEPLYKRSLAIDERAYGPDHPDVATDLENMAGFYKETGREKEALVLLKRASAIRKIKR